MWSTGLKKSLAERKSISVSASRVICSIALVTCSVLRVVYCGLCWRRVAELPILCWESHTMLLKSIQLCNSNFHYVWCRFQLMFWIDASVSYTGDHLLLCIFVLPSCRAYY